MGRQEQIVTRHFGATDPANIDDYAKSGGYEGLRRALKELGPGRAIEEVGRSRLRGRGGDGSAVATRWRTVLEAEGYPKYVICNAYDADVLAPISQTLLARAPHVVLEGMLIAAFAVGANRGFIYCNSQEADAVGSVMRAIDLARERELLGFGILGSDFDFELSVVTYSAGFIAGEETAMIAAISGQRAMPSQQPPYVSQIGYRKRPTLVHSAETFAGVPWIMTNGGEQYARIGTQQSTGTKLIALDGDVHDKTLVELPFGTTIRQAIEEFGKGTAKGKARAAHVGGPLGGCIPENLFDTPLDYDALRELGTTLGSGRITVLNDKACLVNYARDVMGYLANEACGKCVPCRLGTKRIATVLEGITSNLGKAEDLDLIAELGQNMRYASLCGFGIEAPNIVMTSLKYFDEDYRQHLEQGKCPTGECQPTRRYRYQKRAVL